MILTINNIKTLLDLSLSEDYGLNGDITSEYVIADESMVNFEINARQNMVLCGQEIAQYYFTNYSGVKFQTYFQDKDQVRAGETILSGYGKAKEILLLERVVLNFMQHLSGIATLTNEYVKQVEGSGARIFDTRKTLPALRALQKYAVKCGGGHNHRLQLDSGVMIKDNHIAICGSVKEAVKKARANKPHYITIEVECDNLSQVQQALAAKADIIMLDNMSLSDMKKAVEIIGKAAIIEVSGNVSLGNVKDIAVIGVDVISIGKLTHSAPSVDIGLDIK